MFNKSKIKNNFNQASTRYNDNAILQKIVAENLIDFAKQDISEANQIIDFGAGTGFISQKILSEFNNKKVFQLDIAEKMLSTNPHLTPKIVSDIEALPFKARAFDLGISSLTFQWLNNLEKTIPTVLETIKDNQNLYFSTIGNGSLKELKNSCEACQVKLAINDFLTEEQLKKSLTNLNYKIKSEIISLEYEDCYDLLKSIKSIGASYGGNKNYMTKTQFDLLNSFYLKNFNLGHKVFASWQIFYVSIQNS